MIVITDTVDLISSLLTVTPRFKHSYPDTYEGDKFYVINSLGVPKDSIQTVEININCYAKDANIQMGIPDLSTLDTMVNSVISDLNEYHFNGVFVELQMTNLFREEKINSHYINMRFQLTYLSN